MQRIVTRGQKWSMVLGAAVVCAGLALIGAGFYSARGQVAPIAAYFTDNVNATVVTTDVTPLELALLERLQSATTSIDLAIYDFSRTSVLEALIAAHARGITVRVVGDNNARGSLSSRANFDALEAVGIPVVVDGIVPTTTDALPAIPDALYENAPADAAPDALLQSLIMHNKYFIIDKRWVWTGSVNMSDSDISLNHNNALDIDSPALAALYQGDFDQMFAGTFGTDKVAVMTHTVDISGTSARVYFAPQDDPIEQVIDAVNSAQQSIDFAIFTFTDDALADALIAAQARGVRVRGLWDSLAAGNRAADDERMCAAGVAVKIENTRGLMHDKLLVIDAEGDAPQVLTGSLNWTAGGNDGNNENTLVLADAALTLQYAAEFQRLWTAIDVIPCNALRLPIIFNNAEPATPTPLPDVPNPTATQAPTATATGTPTATPSATLTPAVTPTDTVLSGVHMSRIVYDPPGDDAQGEFVEVVNDGAGAAALTEWTLRDAAATPNIFTFPEFTLAPGALVRVWVKAGSNGVTDLFWGRGSPVWNNGGDAATLIDSTGSLVATCVYGAGTGEALCP